MINESFRSRRFDLAVDTITEDDIAALIEWLKVYPRLTMSVVTPEFEAAWSRWLGVPHSVFCNSGSSADLLMYAAMDSAGRSGNRKVVVPATGWSTTVAPAMQLGWQPLMCEADPATFGLDPASLEKILATEKPDNVILVHVLGTPANMGAIMALQQRYGFNLMEDCCAAHGARSGGQLVGTFGCMSAFSFYYGHHMSTIEGGMVSTRDEELWRHLVMLRSHGWCKELPPDAQQNLLAQHGIDPFMSPFAFLVPGYNLRPLDLTAYIGLLQLPRLDATITRRVANHRQYQQLLEGRVGFARAGREDTISSISFGAVAASRDERKKMVTALTAHDIDTRLFTSGNLGRHPFWAARFGEFAAPVADRIYNGGFYLPNNQTLDPADVEFICGVVLKALEAG